MAQRSGFLAEALQSAAAVERQIARAWPLLEQLGARLAAQPPRFVVMNGRGSSGHAGIFGKYLIETECRRFTGSAAQSVVSAYHADLDLTGALLISISQSGKSPDIVRQVESARAHGAFTVAMVNQADSPLALASEITLPLAAGPETSVGATKSFIAALALQIGLVAAWRRDRRLEQTYRALPALLDRAARCAWPSFVDRFAAAGHAFVIGRGYGFAIASEAALKFKEICALPAEAFSAAEVLHGPIALARADLPVLVFDQEDAGSPSVAEVVRQLTAAAAPILLVQPAHEPGAADPWLHPAGAAIGLIQSFYIHLEALAGQRGTDPDRPRLLAKVTQTL